MDLTVRDVFGRWNLLMVLLGIGISTPDSSFAADWSLTASVTERLEIDTNPGLDSPSDGTVYGSQTTLGLTLEGETPRSLLTLEGTVQGNLYGGPGDAEELTQINPGFNIGYSHRGRDWTLAADAGLEVSSTSVATLTDVIDTEVDATRFAISYGLELTQEINAANRVSLGFDGSLIDYDESSADLVPTHTIGPTIGWERTLTETTVLDLSLGFRYFTADNIENTRSQTVDLSAGLSHRRTPRHTFGARLGLTGVRTKEAGAGTDFNVGLTGGLSMAYQLGIFDADLDLRQGVAPSSEGDLENLTSFGAGVSYAVNAQERLTGRLAYTRRSPLSGEGDTAQSLTLGPTYAIEIAPDTGLSVGYLFRMSSGGTSGTGTGHLVFVSLSRDFPLLP